MLSNKSTKQNEKALGWTHDAATDLFHCVSGYGDLSPQIGGRVRGVKRGVFGSSARLGLAAGYSSAVNLIIDTSGWLKDCYFECLFLEKSDPQPDQILQLGHMAITWGGVYSRNLVPCLQARITVDRHTLSDINHAFTGIMPNYSSILLSLDKLEACTFEEFWRILNNSREHNLNVIDYKIISSIGDTSLNNKYKRENKLQEESFIFSQPH